MQTTSTSDLQFNTTLISLGANLGDARATITSAAALIREHFGKASVSFSRLFKTTAVGGPSGQQDFYNSTAAISSRATAFEIWTYLSELEHSLGRRRLHRWESRRIDLDVILHNDDRIWTPTFKVPHPRMSMRTFVVTPAVDCAGEFIDPVTQLRMTELHSRLASIKAARTVPRLLITHDRRRINRDAFAEQILAAANSNAAESSTRLSLAGDQRNDFSIDRIVLDSDQPVTRIARNGRHWIDLVSLDVASITSSANDDIDSPEILQQHCPRIRNDSKFLTLDAFTAHLTRECELVLGDYDLWMHACSSPDVTTVHWEDYEREWAYCFHLIDNSTEEEPIPPSPYRKIQKYLLAANNLTWAAHEVLAATDAMTCPVEACGEL